MADVSRKGRDTWKAMVWCQKEGCGLGIRMVLLQMLFPPTGRGWFLLEMLSICATRLQSLPAVAESGTEENLHLLSVG